MSESDNETAEVAVKRPRQPRQNKTAAAKAAAASETVAATSAPTPSAAVKEVREAASQPPPSAPPVQAEQPSNEHGNTAPKADSGNADNASQQQSAQPQSNDGNQGNQQPGGQPQGGQQQRHNPRRDRFRDRRDRQQGQQGQQNGPRENNPPRNNEPRDRGNEGGEFNDNQPLPALPPDFPIYGLSELKKMPAFQLMEIADKLGITEGVARMRKQDVIFALLKVLTRYGEGVAAEGVLEILPDGFGFLRSSDASYLAGPDDTYISPSQIRRFNLRTGDHLTGRIRSPKPGERYFALSQVTTINNEPPEASKNKALFENLTPLFPRKAFHLERGNGSSEDITGRILDLMAPQGKGQRARIVSPPKAGTT
ncbi:MAG: Rho termination factor N-terminal domain-containing protein, partial [Lysobacteraceae bacterium]